MFVDDLHSSPYSEVHKKQSKHLHIYNFFVEHEWHFHVSFCCFSLNFELDVNVIHANYPLIFGITIN